MSDRPAGVDFIDAPGIDSHLPVLRWAQEATGGSVLELGGGAYSTAALVEWDRLGIRTATVEASNVWRRWLRERWPEHRVVTTPTDLLRERWDVVLIDHGDGPWTWVQQRAEALTLVRRYCRMALVHDWHIGKGHRDHLVRTFAHYGWFAPDDKTMHTAICSDEVEVAGAQIPGGYVYTSWDDCPWEWPN